MKTLEEKVREIADREEIKELTAKYAHWVALGDGAKVAQLFTDDGAFINEVTGQKRNIDVRGRQQLDEFYPRLKRGMALPCIHNHIIEINGDNAKGTCTIEMDNPEQPEHHRFRLLFGHLPPRQRSMEVRRAARLLLSFCAVAEGMDREQLMVLRRGLH